MSGIPRSGLRPPTKISKSGIGPPAASSITATSKPSGGQRSLLAPSLGRSRFGLGAGPSTTTRGIPKTSGIFRAPSSGKETESLLKKFDRTVDAELNRRRDTCNILCEATTSDIDLVSAVDQLAKAETRHVFTGAIRAAEAAAAEAPPEKAEEAAVAGAQTFQAELVDVIKQEIPGLKPIQVLGYVGITRPGKPIH